MEFDTDRIFNWSIGYILSIILFIVFRKEIPNDNSLFRILFTLGLLLFLSAIFYNSLMETNWNLYFIVDILLIKKVGIAGVRKLICAGYLLMLWGISLYLIVLIRDKKKKRSNY